MSIHDYIIKNLKDDTKKEIIDTISDAVNDNDEATLPGMGVLLEILWKNISDEEKNNIALKIVEGIKEEIKNTTK